MLKGRVLFLGGDEFLVDLTSTIFEKRGYEVERAATLDDLMRKIEESTPQLVVIDQMQARGGSASAGCRRLRESFTNSELPLLVLVREGNEATIVEFMDAGADECLAIPYRTTEILAKAALLIRKTCREEGHRLARRAIEKAMAGKQPDLAGGIAFGPYVLEQLLGRGSMGAVFRASPAAGGEPIALKVLDPELQADGRALKRLEREGRILMRLDHPHIVKVRDLALCEGFHTMVMEYVRGESLVTAVERRGPFAAKETARVALQVASALGVLWDAGLIHRDVKPDNIVIEASGDAKLLDFGLARGKEDERVTRSGIIYGTPNYMSPEQIQGMDLDLRTDVYSLGATAYFMMTGTPPFDGPSTRGILFRHVFENLKPPDALRPGSSRGLGEVVCRMMAKSPAERFSGVEDLRSALARVARATGRLTGRAPPKERSRPTGRKKTRGEEAEW